MSTFAGESFPLEDGSIGFDSRLPSQRLDEFSNFEAESVVDSTFSPEQNGKGFGEPDGPILSSPEEMEAEEGFPLREWRRQNAIELKEKEKREKEMLQEIIEEADQYIIDFYRRHKLTTDNNRASNRDKEKRYLENRKKFHAEAEKNYWKAIAELIPSEVPAIESRGKKDKEKKPSIVVIQGPKPGKPTDLARMRQILLKLKHNNPSHMKPKPPPPPPPSESKKDPKGESSAAGSSSNGASTSSTTSKTAAVVTSEGVAAA